MLNLPTILAAVLAVGASLSIGLDGLDASIDSLVAAKQLEQKAICEARTAQMLLPVDRRKDVFLTCTAHAKKEVVDRFASVKSLIESARLPL